MGGLWNKVPVTHWVFLIGPAAIAGFPFLSGWWSKDEILGHAFTHGRYVLWALGAATAFCTAFYMSRLLYVTVYDQARVAHGTPHPLPKPSWRILRPLLFLAALAGVCCLSRAVPACPATPSS